MFTLINSKEDIEFCELKLERCEYPSSYPGIQKLENEAIKYNLVIYNGTLNLYCSTRYISKPNINVWQFKYHNEKKYRPICTIEKRKSQCYYKEEDSLFDGAKISRGHFHISRMNRRHSGQYQCIFKDESNTEDNIFDVTVFPNQLVKYLAPLFVNETLTLFCPLNEYRNTGSKMWRFKSHKSHYYELLAFKMKFEGDWFKTNTRDSQFKTAEVTDEKLHIEQVTPQHDGIYQCRYENESIVVNYIFHVNIIASKRFQYMDTVHFEETLDLHCPLEEMDNSAMKQWLYKSPNSSDYKMLCSNKPDKKECIKNPILNPLFNNTQMSFQNLKIERVTIKYNGLYICKQENKTISMNYTFDVNVNANRRIAYIHSSTHNGFLYLHCPIKHFTNSSMKMWLYKSNKLSDYKLLCMKLPNEKECLRSNNLGPLFANANMSSERLQIDRRHTDHGGIYQCQYWNDSFSRKYTFDVTVEAKQQFTYKRADEDESLTLQCPLVTVGNSGFKLWQFKKDKLSNYRVLCMKKPNENKCIKSVAHDPLFDTTKMTSEKMQIDVVKLHHIGIYQCQFENGSTPLKYTFQITLRAKPIDIYMDSVFQYDPLTIRCPIEIEISAIMFWSFNKKTQCYKDSDASICEPYTSTVFTSEEMTPQMLHIERVQKYHSGIYQCVYDNDSMTLIYNFHVNVKAHREIKYEYKNETSKYEIVCPIKSFSNSTKMMWMFKPYFSSSYTPLCMKKSNESNCSKSNTLDPLFSSAEMLPDKLKIGSLMPHHGGIYQCLYSNESFRLQHTFHLTVTENKQLEYVRTLLEYESLTLHCRGNSSAQFGSSIWSFMSNKSRNFVPLCNVTESDTECEPKFNVTLQISSRKLHVDQLTTLHSGMYQCKISDKRNIFEKTFIVNVIANKRIDNMDSKFIKKTVILHCPIENFVYSARKLWLLKSDSLNGYRFLCMEKPDESKCIKSSTLDTFIINLQHSFHDKQIERMNNVHGGLYQCQYAARNILTKYTFGLNLIEKQPIKFMVPVVINGSLTLHCPIKTSDNSATMMWLFMSDESSEFKFMCMKMPDESECIRSRTLNLEFATENTHAEKMRIERVTAHHGGIYQCQYIKGSTWTYTFHVTVIDGRNCDFCSNWPKIISFKLFCKNPLRMKVKVMDKRSDSDYDLEIQQIWPELNRQILFLGEKIVKVRITNEYCKCMKLKVDQSYLIMDTNFFFGQFSKSDGTILTRKSFVEKWNDVWTKEVDYYSAREIEGRCYSHIYPTVPVVYPRDAILLKPMDIENIRRSKERN